MRHTFLILIFLLVPVRPAPAADGEPDAIDRLRQRWLASLVGDEHFDPAAPGVRERVEAQAREARVLWDSLAKPPGEDLWPSLKTATASAGLTATAARLASLARAWATRGSALYHDPALGEALRAGARWFLSARYHPGATPYDNWWDWQIGVPLALEPCLACLGDELPPETRLAATDAIESFTPVISATGANGAWRAEIILRRALLVRDPAKLAAVRDWMNASLLVDAEPPADPAAAPEGFREGFYRDGSFFAHGRHPYNGGYGASALASAAGLAALVAGTPWDVAPDRRARVGEWVANAFEPLLFRGTLFDGVRGREISRPLVPGLLLGRLLAAADAAPDPSRAGLLAYVKGVAAEEGTAGLTPPQAARLQELLAAPAVPAAAPAVGFRHFPLMARTAVLRAGFGAAVSFCSDAVYDYESLNHENLRGWHTGDGWLQILDADRAQFSDGYWPAVDWHRLPGTTVVRGAVKPPTRPNGSPWAGGADLDGVNGAAGFELRPFTGEVYEPGQRQKTPATDGQTLKARKSWFFLGDEVFCVGTGITADDDAPVETILENRRLAGEGGNVLTVDGQPLAAGEGEQTATARWWHLAGNVPGSGLGGVFAGPTRLQALRETRVGSWREINESGDAAPVRRRFLTLWLDHGVRPAGAAYAYALLPGRDAAAVARWAADPATLLRAATDAVHAVEHRPLGIWAANFWQDAPATLALDGPRRLTVDRRACVLYRHRDGVTELAVSDPTRANRAAIRLAFNVPLGRVLSADADLRADASAEGTVITLDLSGVPPGERRRTCRIRLAD